MNQTSRTIIKNTSVLLASQMFTWILAFLLEIFLTRYIGPDNIGMYAVAVAIWMIVGIVVTFGTDTYMTKEIACNPARTPELLGTVVVLRGLFLLVSCGVIALYLYLVQYPLETVLVICILGLAQPIAQFGNAFGSSLQGLEVMEYLSLAEIVSKVVNFVLSFAIIFLNYDIYAVAATSSIVALAGTSVLVTVLLRRCKVRPIFKLNLVRTVLGGSYPFLLSGVIVAVYFQVDTLILSTLVENHVLGWYSAAISLNGTLQFLPSILTMAIFPALARSYGESSEVSAKLLRKSFDLLFLISVPIGLGLAVIADPLIWFLFGAEFAQSGPILAVMGPVVIFTYLATLLGRYIIAANRTHIWTATIFCAVLLTFPLDFALIPWCQQLFNNGGVGGALSFMLTELGMVIVGLALLPKGTFTWHNVRVSVSALLAGILMMVVCWQVRDMLLVIPIAVGAVTYIGTILLLRVIPREDIELLLGLGRDTWKKLRLRKASVVQIREV